MSTFRYPQGFNYKYDATVNVYKQSVATTSAGVKVGPTYNPLVFDTSLRTWNIDETTPGSITYEILNGTELNIIMPATAAATNGDHITYRTAGPSGNYAYIIIQKGGTPPVITGDWVSGPSANFPWIYVVLPNGNTSAQNNALLSAALNANTLFLDNDSADGNPPQTATDYAGGEISGAAETTTKIQLRKTGDVVNCNIQGISFSGFTGNYDGLIIPIPENFLPPSALQSTSRYLQNCFIASAGAKSAISGIVMLDGNGNLMILTLDSDQGFQLGDGISIGDISVSWTTTDFS